MSWVTFDDGAPLHRKQLAAGAKACWLWACGLAYCYGQESEDGFIPDAAVQVLYPRLGAKEAQTLVKVGLWERVDGGYLIHDYIEWKRRRFEGAKATRGKLGGAVSSEAKRAAALKREADRRLARQTTTSTTTTTTTEHNQKHNDDHNETTTVVTTTTSPTDRASDLPSGSSGSLSDADPESSDGFSSARGRLERPRRPPSLLAVRVDVGAYEPLGAHWDYAVELGLTDDEIHRARLDVRDKFGGKKHDETWLDDKFCAFLEQAARSKASGPRRPAGSETPAERRTREQLERVERLRAEEAAEDARTGGAP